MKKSNIILIFILLILGFLTVIPLLQQGFIPIHDNTQVARVYEMKSALQDGAFPVRLVKDLGYGFGYPIFNFYAPLSYYVGGAINLFGVSSLLATKLLIGIEMILSGVTMYLLAKLFVRKEGALVASALYVFAPYHAVNLYVRGAVAELFAYALLPFAFYTLIRLYRAPSARMAVLSEIGLAGVILSHNLTALMLIPFYAVLYGWYLFRSLQQKRFSVFLLLGGVLGLMISCFYWVPAILEMKYTNVSSLITGGSVYTDHFVCLSQLWYSPWGFGGSGPGCIDGISFQIGKLHLLFACLAVAMIFASKVVRNVLIVVLVAGIISVFVLLPLSSPIWAAIPFLSYIQFPWRFLQFVSLFFSLAGGIGLGVLLDLSFLAKKKAMRLGITALSLIAIVILYQKNFMPQYPILFYPDQTSREQLLWTVSKISDEYLQSTFPRPIKKEEVALEPVITKTGSLTVTKNTSEKVEATITSSQPQMVVVNKAVFPAWRFFIDDQVITPEERNGRYILQIPSGTSSLVVSFNETLVEKFSNLVSLVGIAISVIGIIMLSKKKQKHAKTS